MCYNSGVALTPDRKGDTGCFSLHHFCPAMVNYYDILNVSHEATSAEIKSAYRRLARQLHPDKNNGSEETALKFAAIAEAYETLGNTRERSKYDRRLAEITQSANGDGQVFTSDNKYSRRWRQMAYEKRFNEIIDRMILEERRESIALQRFIFPLVALFIALLFVGIVRPNIFMSDFASEWSRALIRIAIVTLFAVGLLHLIGRMREALERFGYDDQEIHESVFDETELPQRHWSRYSLLTIMVLGTVACLAIGYAIGFGFNLTSQYGYLFADGPTVDVLLFPPIFVLLVDTVHKITLTESR
ncbi:MAG TPA: J domain-containing protein [Pyrinomonadaceae bacterium]|nr:J domain-containing protein [Pyrinomonadaceae bacterium]